jgi:hypothetical protein
MIQSSIMARSLNLILSSLLARSKMMFQSKYISSLLHYCFNNLLWLAHVQ